MHEYSAATFARVGAHRFRAALGSSLPALEDALADLHRGEAGIRIRECPAVRPVLVGGGRVGSIAARALGEEARPVRAILFDKSAGNNWSLGWHQDRTICVKERREVAGFGPWTRKAGMHHVAPPADVLSRMVTLRVHLDDVPAENAPLIIAPGSHLYGRVAETELDALVEKCGTATCLARAGDVWLYSTLILHASGAASHPARRRVLQVDYAAESLPGGLEWLEV
jgi:hypothetical protein